jgi:hypothetical protein
MANPRKLLFVLFRDDVCTANHVCLYALGLAERGHEVAFILEGSATALVAALDDPASALGRRLATLQARGILKGACRTAAHGCSKPDPGANVSARAEAAGLPLLGELEGHADIIPWLEQGYELVIC